MKTILNIFSLTMIFFLLLSIVGLLPTEAQAAALWEIVGVPGFSGETVGYIALALDNGVPYVAYTDVANSNKASVMKFNGTAWVTVGTPGFSDGMANFPSLVLDNGTPYVAYIDGANGNKATVMKFEEGAWVTVGTPGFSAGVIASPSLAIDDGTPYVAYTDGANSNKASVMKFNGTAWVHVGAPGFSAGWIALPSLALDDGTPYLVYRDGTISSKATVMKFNGSAWVTVGAPGFSAGGAGRPSLALDSDTPYIAYVDNANSNKVSTMKFDGTSWVIVGVPGFSGGEADFTSLALDNGTPYVAYTDVADSNTASVMKFDGAAWVTVGAAGFSAGSVDSTVLAVANGTLYVVYRDYANANKASVMKFVSDITPPVTPIITAPATFTSDTTPTIRGTAEADSLVNIWYFDELGSPVQICQDILTDGAGNWSCDSSVPLPEREIELAVNATDAAGNTSSDASYFFTVDFTDPGAPVVLTPSAGAYINEGTPMIGGTAEVGSRVNIWYFDELGDPIQICQDVPVDGLGDWSCVSMEDLPEGEIELNIVAYDEADNPSEPTRSSFIVDLTGPDVTLNVHPADPTNSPEAEFKFSAADNFSTQGDLTFFCKLEKGGTTVYDWEDCSGNPGTKSYNNLDEGTYTFSLNVIDKAGNELYPAFIKSYTWFIDRTAPGVNIDTYPVALSNRPDATFTFSSMDGTATFTCNLDNSGYSSCNASKNYSSLPEGLHVFSVKATDVAGSVSTNSYAWSIDTISPAVRSIVRLGADQTKATNLDFIVTFSENVTGIDMNAPYHDFGLSTTGVTGASITGIYGSGSLYKVTVNTGFGHGTIRLDVVDDDSIMDEANNPLGGAGTSNGNYMSGEEYTILKTKGAITTGVFRPSNGALYLKNTHETGFADIQINYGVAGDYPVVGDWDGDGKATIGIYRNGSFYLRNSNTIGFADLTFPFGMPGDQPVAGDWDGDGKDTIGVYRNGIFFLRNNNSAGAPDATFALGIPGDVGIAGDWDGDGLDTTGVFRPSNGALYLKNVNTTGFADIQINYGLPGDRPVTGDWDKDGIDTIGIYRNGEFYLRNSNTIGFADIVFALGIPGDMPIAGNWDGKP
jgi:hypothetical protein